METRKGPVKNRYPGFPAKIPDSRPEPALPASFFLTLVWASCLMLSSHYRGRSAAVTAASLPQPGIPQKF